MGPQVPYLAREVLKAVLHPGPAEKSFKEDVPDERHETLEGQSNCKDDLENSCLKGAVDTYNGHEYDGSPTFGG